MTRSRRGTRRSRTKLEHAENLPERCLISGKRVYPTEDKAFEDAISFNQNNGFTLTSRSVYKCLFCAGYHITGGKK